MKIFQLATLCFICLLGILSDAATAQPFLISADGSEVTDQKTGLIWRRCSEGKTWNGTGCIGSFSTFTHEAALIHASTQATSTGVAWRLPNVKELASIADRTRFNPAVDTIAFPSTPGTVWSSSPYAAAPTNAWIFDFYGGYENFSPRNTRAGIRLVRDGL